MKRRLTLVLLALLLAVSLIPQTAFAAKQKYSRETYPVRVTALPIDAGSASINGSVYTSKAQPSITVYVTDGKTLTLSAKSEPGWSFSGWHLDSSDGELISTEPDCEYRFSAPADTKKQPVTDIVASFELGGSAGASASEPALSFSFSPETLDFKEAVEDAYADIEPQPVNVRNTGDGMIQINADEESSCFELSVKSFALAPGEYANIFVTPRQGLGAGTYNGYLTLSMSDPRNGALVDESQIPVTFKIAAAPAEELPRDELIPFDDVLPEDYFAEAVHWAYFSEPQVTNGMTADLFGPDATCTRGQVVTFLWRAVACPEPASSANPFSDVAPGAYYEKAVLWAVEQGITNGTSETSFSPDATCTYEHIITFIYRLAGEPGKGSAAALAATYGGSAAWYSDAQNWAVSAGDMLKDTGFSIGKDCPRKDVVQFLYYFMNFVEL